MPPLRILLLHGYTQNPTLFRSKTRALSKHLSRAFPTHDLQLTYLQAPHRLVGADIPGYQHDAFASSSSSSTSTSAEKQDAEGKGEEGDKEEPPESYAWWKRKDAITKDGETAVTYAGLDATFRLIADTIRASGPYDGIIGFSQGAACAAMVASLLEGAARKDAFDAHVRGGGMPYPSSFLLQQTEEKGEEKGEKGEEKGQRGNTAFIQPPLKFAICYSGFKAPGKMYAAFYEPRIKTRVLCVMGQVDVVVDEVRGMGLVSACEGGEGKGRLVVHPGGHFVPSQRPWLDAVVGFVRESIMEGEGEGEVKRGDKEEEEERVEDMEVPF